MIKKLVTQKIYEIDTELERLCRFDSIKHNSDGRNRVAAIRKLLTEINVAAQEAEESNSLFIHNSTETELRIGYCKQLSEDSVEFIKLCDLAPSSGHSITPVSWDLTITNVDDVRLCPICNLSFVGLGHDPWPLKTEGACCDNCYKNVIKAQIKLHHKTIQTKEGRNDI